jgi:excisionase family DNA binding protein
MTRTPVLQLTASSHHANNDVSIDTLPMLLTINEVATLLRTSRKAIYAMIERGQLPGVTRIGRRVLVYSRDLLHSLDQKRRPSLESQR